MKFEFSRQILEKCSYTKFHENPSTGSRVVPCRRTEGQTLRSLIVTFRNFASVPKTEALPVRGRTGIKGEYMNSSYLSLNFALDGVGG